jgi:uncharacterized protein (TIGR02246 family)
MRADSDFKVEQPGCRPANRPRHTNVATWRHITRCGVAILALAAMLCGPAFVHGQKGKNNKKKDKDGDASISASSLLPDNQAVDLLVSQMLGAWQAGDADGLHKFYADDITVISGAWEPPVFGWTNYARAYQAQIARTSVPRLERTNSYTKVMGDTAMVTYQWQFAGNVDGKRTQAFGHTTLVLQKRAGNWLIVLNHTSAIPTEDSPAGTPTSAAQPTSSLVPGAR